ncbi:Hypothetical_protein [Hexamita inflata]|uniref:Hypothetical_protein n=1 Tax=Hexamita inflata TaxID=28002 RepID=A0AA86PN42_9EUKA|nr:Hypothetical protein HINF_LOCUS26095 [Hexamita inflata]
MDATAKLILAVLIIFPVYCFAMTCAVRGLHKAVLRLKLKKRIEKRVQDVYNTFPPLVYNPSLVQQLSPKIGMRCDSSLVLQHNHQNQQMHVSDLFESVVLQEEDLDASTLVFSQPEMFRIENEILFANNAPVSLLSDLLKADGSPLIHEIAGTSISGSGDIIQNGAVIMNIKDIFVKNIDGKLTSLQTASEFSVSNGVVYFKQKPLCRVEDVINSGESSNKSIIISANGSVFSDGVHRGFLRDLYFQNTKRLLDSCRFQVLDGTLCHDMKPLCRLQDARDRNGCQVPDAFVSTCGCVFSGGEYICDASDLTVNTDTGKQSVEAPSPFGMVGGVVFRGEQEYCKLHTDNIKDGLTISSNGSIFKDLKYLGNVRSSSEFKVENGTLFQSGKPLCQIESITTKNIAVLQNGAVYENTEFVGRVEKLKVEVFSQKCLLEHNMFQIEGGVVYFDKIPIIAVQELNLGDQITVGTDGSVYNKNAFVDNISSLMNEDKYSIDDAVVLRNGAPVALVQDLVDADGKPLNFDQQTRITESGSFIHGGKITSISATRLLTHQNQLVKAIPQLFPTRDGSAYFNEEFFGKCEQNAVVANNGAWFQNGRFAGYLKPQAYSRVNLKDMVTRELQEVSKSIAKLGNAESRFRETMGK